jgi:hypothetical protein
MSSNITNARFNGTRLAMTAPLNNALARKNQRMGHPVRRWRCRDAYCREGC